MVKFNMWVSGVCFFAGAVHLSEGRHSFAIVNFIFAGINFIAGYYDD